MPVLVVDVANVMGSRPDGWWRDRAGAATRLMVSLVPLVAVDVDAPKPGSRTTGVQTTTAQTTTAETRTAQGAGAQTAGAQGAGTSRPGGRAPSVRIDRVVAVVEGRARTASAPAGLEVVLASADGDSAIVAIAQSVLAGGEIPLVVTADRGLRERLPSGSRVAGPGWLLALV